MKKLIITLIALMPFFLMVTISQIGKILTNFRYVSVESVFFVLDNGEYALNSDFISIKIGETHELNVKVLPEYATEKAYKFKIIDEEVVTINEDGLLLALSSGETKVIVETDDKGIQNSISVKVPTPDVGSINLISDETIDLYENEVHKIQYEVLPLNVTNKSVSFISSNLDVATVNEAGEIKALSQGQAVITITAIANTNATATITVNVSSDSPFKIRDDLPNYNGSVYITNTDSFDLSDILAIKPELLVHDYLITAVSSSADATISENTIISFHKENKLIAVTINYYKNSSDSKPSRAISLVIVFKNI